MLGWSYDMSETGSKEVEKCWAGSTLISLLWLLSSRSGLPELNPQSQLLVIGIHWSLQTSLSVVTLQIITQLEKLPSQRQPNCLEWAVLICSCL